MWAGTGAAGDCGVLLRAEPRAAGAARTSSSLRGLITPIAVSAGDDMALERSRGLGLNPCLRGLSYICGANPPGESLLRCLAVKKQAGSHSRSCLVLLPQLP